MSIADQGRQSPDEMKNKTKSDIQEHIRMMETNERRVARLPLISNESVIPPTKA